MVLTLTLTCPHCGKRMDVDSSRRFQFCASCGTHSYLRPEKHSLFLRALQYGLVDDRSMQALARAEQSLNRKMKEMKEREDQLRHKYEADRKKGSMTFRLLVINLVIISLSALLLFRDLDSLLQNSIPSVILAALALITILMMIILETGLKASEFKLTKQTRRFRELLNELHKLQRSIDRAVIGSSGE